MQNYLNYAYCLITTSFIKVPLPPLLIPIAVYVAGIGSCYWYGLNGLIFVPLMLLLGIGITRDMRACVLSLLLPSILGFFLFYRQQYRFTAFNNQWDRKKVCIKGRIDDIAHTADKRYPYMVTLTGTYIKEEKENMEQPFCYSICIYCHQRPLAEIGDYIALQNILYKKPTGSYALYLLKEKIGGSLFRSALEENVLAHSSSFQQKLYAYRQEMITYFKQHMSPTTFAFFCALFLGNKLPVKVTLEKHKMQFQIWGISHYLARSGLHMVIITMLLLALMSLLPFHLQYKRILVVGIIILYHLCSWPTISFLRAFYTALLYFCCNLCALPIYALHIFCLVCLYILLVNPAQALFLDFQLSFGLTCALAWFNQIMAQRRLLAQNY